VDPERALDVVSRLRRHADGAARTFVDLFLEEIWKPFDEAGRPEERWPEVMEALERLRPLAGDVLLAMFGVVMTDRVDAAFGRELSRLTGTDGRDRRSDRRVGRRRRSRR
jgi:hypothetical protein